jgi:pilus assembly protein Flp/PilA
MNHLLLLMHDLMVREEGQDLVEYALVVALIAFGAITGMTQLAQGLNLVFSSVATTLTADV